MLTPAPPAPTTPEHALTPDEEAALGEAADRLAVDRQRALKDPGSSWRDWFLGVWAKWWLGLAFVVVDSWIASFWANDGVFSGYDAAYLGASLAVAVYLEILLYLFLWRIPSGPLDSAGRRFRPSWKALREIGRWVPVSERRALRTSAGPAEGAPDPREFL